MKRKKRKEKKRKEQKRKEKKRKERINPRVLFFSQAEEGNDPKLTFPDVIPFCNSLTTGPPEVAIGTYFC